MRPPQRHGFPRTVPESALGTGSSRASQRARTATTKFRTMPVAATPRARTRARRRPSRAEDDDEHHHDRADIQRYEQAVAQHLAAHAHRGKIGATAIMNSNARPSGRVIVLK